MAQITEEQTPLQDAPPAEADSTEDQSHASSAPSADEHAESTLPDGAIDNAGEQGEAEAPADSLFDETPDVSLGAVEALLFSTHSPLTAGRLAELLGLPSTKAVKGAVKQLNAAYSESGRAFRIEQVAGGYQMLTLPEHGEVVRRLVQKEADAKLTKSALETLAVVAYKQPILRADIEAIRGVACGETIRSLMEKHLVKIAGRAELPGRPILYGTTKRFLELFGLNSLKDLPKEEDGLRALPARTSTGVSTSPGESADSPAAQPRGDSDADPA